MAIIKASIEVLHPALHQSFHVRKLNEEAFRAPYHFHPEFELTTIIKGNGKRYVGNHMENFHDGDIVLLGSNLPHCWKLDTKSTITNKSASAVIVQFNDEFLGKDFFNKAELIGIKNLLNDSQYGIHFPEKDTHRIQDQLISLTLEKDNLKALIALMSIFHSLTTCTYRLLDKDRITASQSFLEQERMNPVLAYIVENFNGNISLKEAAGIAHMSTNAFCKYFKKTTRKTFMETVIDYRLNYARQQLIQTNKSISDISFESGFGDISHFYKLFKSKTKLSPLNYRKKFISGIV